MGLPEKYLGDGEHEVIHLHTHVKALFLPILIFIVDAVALGCLLAITAESWKPAATYIEVGLALIVFIIWVLYPFLKWATTTYTFTNRRIITRTGIITKKGHDLPLSRINNVSYERGLTDRMLGCGTLILTTAAEAPVVLHDIPHVEEVHVMMTELLFSAEGKEDTVMDS
ncbi:MAG: PH domain-containing protein [Propionibacteriaceae bacterium]|jgi:uncharacterized membrane protein YdbT with pleckstrin-like domain|nr:PH domain-containing protein [Propionibacteriaceae bacterium]